MAKGRQADKVRARQTMTAKKAGQEAPNSAYQDAKPTSTPKN